uniref:BSD domain-containing protein n=1 Tax=Hymenolepis diminuta TaxID=6216 RepID=A0A0R3SL40_HYMDI
LVLDYFQSARKGYSWQPLEEVTIKPSDIRNVRCRLGGLKDLPDDDICDALRFVHSEHQYLPTFFIWPPPDCRMNELNYWHYFYAARALILRQVYALAPQMTFDQCLKALASSDWNYAIVISKILF